MYALARTLFGPVQQLLLCSCGSLYDPSDPGQWSQHKNCR